MTAMDAQSGGKSVVKTTIGYNDPSSTTATGQVTTWKSGATTYTYAYDARGNITSVSDGKSTTTYAYDSFDQLVRENNQAAGKDVDVRLRFRRQAHHENRQRYGVQLPLSG